MNTLLLRTFDILPIEGGLYLPVRQQCAARTTVSGGPSLRIFELRRKGNASIVQIFEINVQRRSPQGGAGLIDFDIEGGMRLMITPYMVFIDMKPIVCRIRAQSLPELIG